MSKGANQFQTVRTEGAILPPDVLRRIAAQSVDGISPESYHLPPSIKLNESISHSWNLLRAHWKAFQEARLSMASTEETGTSITNERWMLPLFQELGYGRLITTKAPEIDGRRYPIERFYNHAPIHLIGFRLPLDRRTRGARGAATSSPHSMVQEFLNRSEEGLWGMLSNGLQLRLLRDNASLSRQAFVEFDLEAMMEGEVYADFALLWMVCHQSRLEAARQSDCWLEKWSRLARDQGTRVLDSLRKGVQDAIEALGRGFISHPRNDGLRRKLRDGGLSRQDYYRQLLRIVYRLLFLFVAEDRSLLHPPDADEGASDLYDEHYSTARLRRLAQSIRGSKHHDLWSTFCLVCDVLGRNEGCPTLGLSGLGSFLWRRSSTPDLLGPPGKGMDPVSEAVYLANDDLLAAVRALAYVEQDRVLRSVDYRNLGSEELGSVYESLLELHPVITIEARSFSLSVAGGNERKTSGSYYTPDSLVQCLLDSALEPVVAEKIQGKKAEESGKAILDLKVCDPACGSGHFLIAASHRLARHLARARTAETEPSPEEYQHALRDVISRCIYGVDLNPMAVELCKVSLWIEALEPGKPLSFLDHHIQVGNSLLGTTPPILARGIPDEAFEAIEGDDKKVCSALKQKNKAERAGQTSFAFDLALPVSLHLGNIAEELLKLDTSSDGTLQDVASKAERYAQLIGSSAYENNRLLADTWCAAFVVRKVKADPLEPRIEITHDVFRRMRENPHKTPWGTREEIKRIAQEYQFFHWHLAFPDVFQPADSIGVEDPTGSTGGFDVVLGNPPWERIKLQEQEWFAERCPEVAKAPNAAARKRMIAGLEQGDPRLHAAFLADMRGSEGERHFVRNSGRYPLCGRGDVNTYSIFAETNRMIVSNRGRVGCIVPAGIATDDTTKVFFQDLVERRSLVSLYHFENEEKIFPGVHHAYRFVLLTIGPSESATFLFYARRMEHLNDSDRLFTLSAADFALLNPNTRTCPTFRSRRDAELNKRIYTLIPTLIETDGASQWSAYYMRLVDFDDHAEDIRFPWQDKGDECWNTPLYESKLVNLFDHRFATFDGVDRARFADGQPRATTNEERNDPAFQVAPRYLVRDELARELFAKYPSHTQRWLLVWRDIVRATDERTSIVAVIPKTLATRSNPSLGFLPAGDGYFLLADLSSFVFDYLARQKVGGIHLNWQVLAQLPVAHPSLVTSASRNFIRLRVLELTYTSWDLQPFAEDCGWTGPPFRWDEERRFLLRCELDAAFFHIYLSADESSHWRPVDGEAPEDLAGLKVSFPTPRHAVTYIMETFFVLRRRDEEKYGEYRTKRVILEIYDAMQEAIRTGQPYQTRLDPPPADPRCCHPSRGNRIPPTDVMEATA